MADNPYMALAQQDVDTSANPYLDIARQDAVDQVRQSVASTASLNPDAEAKVQQLARQYNLPPTAVRSEQPRIERKATLDAIDYELLARDNPKTAGFLSDPQKAAVARDDIDTLKELERSMGVLQSTQYPGASLSNFVKGVFSSFATGGELTKQGLRTQFGDLLGDQPYAQGAIKDAERARFRQSLIDPLFETSTAQGIYSGATSVAQMAPGVAASIALRTPLPGLGVAGLQTQTEAYTRYRARGASPLQALAGSTVEGATEIATELLPMGTIVNKLGRTGATKFLSELLVQDMTGEQIATFVQDAVDTAVANPDKTWGDFFSERPDAAYQTAIATLTASGAVTGANVALNRMAGLEQRAAQARRNAQALEQLSKLAAASKLRGRDAESFQQFIEQATQDGPVSDVYIDPQTLAQSGVDLTALAQASPSVATQLQEALATHSDVKIPVAEYMATLAGTDAGNALLDHLKTDPSGMSRLQAEEFYQTQGEQLKADVEKILTEKQNDDVFKASRDNVYQRYLGELNAVNRHTADVNAPYALMHANFDAAMGARLGMTPEQFAEKFPRKFASELTGKAPRLDQVTREQALATNVKMEMPTDPVFNEAVSGTTGAKVTDEGLVIDLVRFQKPEQEGAQAVRTGVFYLPTGSKNARYYKNAGTASNANSYGGTEKFQGETLIRRPLFVKGATGGKAPETAYEGLMGKGSFKKLESAVMSVVNSQHILRDRDLVIENIKNFLREHNADPDLAYEIVANSGKGNQLRYALQENVIAHAVRDAGYDAVVGYSKGRNGNGHFISEVFDVREQTYPARGTDSEVHTVFDKEANGSTPYSSPTITIDGVEKPTTNSNGQPIAATREGLENFWRWFGDSKVVDADGKPLVVYHGGRKGTQVFNNPDPKYRPGIFFTSSKKVADAFGKGGETYPVYLSFQTPYTLDAKGRYYNDIKRPKEMKGWALIDPIETDIAGEFAIEKGYDSAVVQNVWEGRGDEVSDVYIALEPTQIKSVYNEGQFSPANPDILHQSAWHGSPHRFEKFDLSQIGTGEGAQVQGWGLYFAERESVGRSYFDQLGGSHRPILQVKIGSLTFGERDGFDYSRKASQNTLENIRASLAEDVMIAQSDAMEAHDAGKFQEFVLKVLDDRIDDYKSQPWEEGIREAEKLRRMLSSPGAVSMKLGETTGNLYKLDIPDEAKARMLDWDAPLNQQPQVVQDALANSGVLDQVLKAVNTQRATLKREPFADPSDFTGEALYQNLAALKGSDKEASLYLDTLGIPGVRYWDGGSRNVAGTLTNWRVSKYANEDVYTLSGDNARLGGRVNAVFHSRREIENIVGKERLDQALQYAKDNVGQQMEFSEPVEVQGHQNIVVWSQDVLDQINETVDTLYQSTNIDPDASPWYYSQVQRTVENLKMSKAPAEQWLKTIQNTPGVKQEELDWMGLPEWLAKQEGSIAKADLLAFIEANQITVDEVVKGAPITALPDGVTVEQDEDGQFYVADKNGDRIGFFHDTEQEAIDDAMNSRVLRDQMGGMEVSGDTKFGQYVLPGGENYRELLMTLPTKTAPQYFIAYKDGSTVGAGFASESEARTEMLDTFGERADLEIRAGAGNRAATDKLSDNYKSSHFNEKNIVAHLRFNERTDADGKRVLFVEEIQSDWHQAGRDKGYGKGYQVVRDGRNVVQTFETEAEADAYAASNWSPDNNVSVKPVQGVPDAPFKTTWPELAFKRALRWAVDNGFDRVAWTTGEQQAERYDLSKQVDEIRYAKNDDGTYNIVPFKDGTAMHSIEKENVKESQLADFFGKDVAKRMTEGVGDGEGRVKTLSGENLKVGGEGMRAFYDKMLPNMVNKMVKKWGGRVGETSFARVREIPVQTDDTGTFGGGWAVEQIDGSRQVVASKVEAEAMQSRVHSLDITPEMRAAAKAGLALFQEKRGAFNPSTSTITLLKAADLSTFLHESGHFFLETMNKLALDANAPANIKADMDTVLKWFGVGSLVEWNAMTLDQQRDNHEKFARGFEAYLFEGKAPSIEMKGIFQRFRSWLLSVYSSLKSLRVELNDDVRKVFDRMLATSEQIKEVENLNAALPLFVTARDAGMTDEEFKNYYATGLEATANAVDELQTRSLRDMKWLSNAKDRVIKKMQRDAEAKRAAIRKEVTAEVLAEPVNQARQFLKRGTYELPEDASKEQRRMATEMGLNGHKLSLAMLKETYGEEGNAIWRSLPTGQYGFVAAEGGLNPDDVADMFGYGSGDEMIRALLAAENPKDKITGLTDQRMLERYGDLTDQQAIEQAANEAVHNDARARFISTELNALQKSLGNRNILAKAAREYATAMVNRQKVRELSPYRYTSAETRAAKASAEAFKKGDTATAAAEKKSQLVQNYAAKAANEAQERIDKGVAYVKKFERDSIRKVVSPEYVDQIAALLERYDFKKRSLKEVDKRASLADWVKAQQEVGIEPDIPKDILEGIGAKSYKDMTVEEFDGLIDTIRQIEHLGRLKNKLLTAADNRSFDATVDAMVARINESSGNRPDVDNTTPNNADTVGKVILGFKSFVAAHRKVANIVRELDGWRDGGPVWDALIRSMNKRGDMEATMRAQATRKLAELVAPVIKQEKMGGKGTYFPTIGRSLNREGRIAIALNTGNLGNVQRLLDGEGWTIGQLQPVLNTLSKEDWDFCQNIWDFFESYRPQIAAKERRVYGVEPEWVEAHPVSTPFGSYRGGYYPIKFDPARSIQAEQHSDAENAKQMMQGAYTSATTRRSFTKSRVDEVKGRPLMYSMDGIFQGANEVIHDLSWHEWLIDANRLLRSRRLDNAIRSRFGALYVRQLKTAMTDIAAGEIRSQNALDSVIAHIRTGASIAGLGLNIKNALINLTGVSQSVVRVGPQWMAQGVGEWVRRPKGLLAEVYEKSEFMRNRAQTFNREINEIRNLIKGETDARRRLNMLMYLPMTATQVAVDTPTWWGAYQKAISEGNGEDRAVSLADQAVLDAQGGGQMKDLAAIQRGGEAIKLFTTFYGYFSTTYNLTLEATKKTNFRDPSSVLQLAGNYAMLYAVPIMLGTLINVALLSGGGGSDDTPEEITKRMTNDGIGYMMSTVVGLREFSGAVSTVAGVNPYVGGYSGPAGLRFIDEVYNLGQQIHQGDADMGLLKAGINVGGIALHLPSGQINRTIGGIVALSEGKTSNPLAVVAGPPPKK